MRLDKTKEVEELEKSCQKTIVMGRTISWGRHLFRGALEVSIKNVKCFGSRSMMGFEG